MNCISAEAWGFRGEAEKFAFSDNLTDRQEVGLRRASALLIGPRLGFDARVGGGIALRPSLGAGLALRGDYLDLPKYTSSTLDEDVDLEGDVYLSSALALVFTHGLFVSLVEGRLDWIATGNDEEGAHSINVGMGLRL